MRNPKQFRTLVLDTFKSGPNLQYLERAIARAPLPPGARDAELTGLLQAVMSFAAGDGRSLVYSDPLAQRADLRRAPELWDEVQRLNRAFLASRVASIADRAVYFDPAVSEASRLLPVADPAEDYAFQMFTADSLRPPGLEHLNAEPYHSLYDAGVQHAGRCDGFQWSDNAPPQWYGPARAGTDGATDRPQPWKRESEIFRRADRGESVCGMSAAAANAGACGYQWSDSFRHIPQPVVARGPSPAAECAARAPREAFASHPNGAADYSQVEADGAETVRAHAEQYDWPATVAAEADQLLAAAAGRGAVPSAFSEGDVVRPRGSNGRAGRERFAMQDPSVPEADRPWDEADPDRTPEAAMEHFVSECGLNPEGGPLAVRRRPSVIAAATAVMGGENRRFMRYEGIPFWQIHGRRDHERDIDGTLGQAHTEYESQVRGMDMEALQANGPCGYGSYFGRATS